METASESVSSTYNITLKLGSLLSLPSRFIARIRKLDDMFGQDLDPTVAALGSTAAVGQRDVSRIHSVRPPPAPDTLSYELVAMPGPLAFLTSGYAVGLVAMALLLNRIQHIVVPPRRSFAYRLIRSRRSVLHAFFYTFFPIDLSSTGYRLALRIPSLYYLLKSLSLLTVILLQVSNLWPSIGFSWVQAISQWASQKEMTDVCWSTFGAVCFALVITALTRGLEGVNSSNTSPFNLFGYAMLLHIYSVPLTHANKGPPSRPDKNVMLSIILPLLQLTMIHFLGVKKHWSHYRLVPTSICSLATLLHFNIVLLTKPSSYPLLNYLPCLLETILLVVTLLTCTLNALTQLLLEGEIRRPLFGHTRTLAPKWDEDFAVVLLRLGTASLEATNVAGLGNEVGPIAVRGPQDTDILAKNKGKGPSSDDGVVELTSAGVLSVSPAKRSGQGNKGKRTAAGFANEIRHVKVSGNDSDWLIDHTWLRELARFGLSLLAVLRGFYRLLIWLLWYKWHGVVLHLRPYDDDSTSDTDTVAQPSQSDRTNTPGTTNEEDTVYARFLRGENVSDDDEDYIPQQELGETDSVSDSMNVSDDEAERGAVTDGSEDVNTSREAAGLYTDLLSSTASTSTSPAPILVAHMTSSSDSPLTRRRYNKLVADTRRHTARGTPEDDGKDQWFNFVRERRAHSNSDTFSPVEDSPNNSNNDGRYNCVICTTEPREIICWPCRCLALCNDCRENLASRFSASKHSCPCCRRGVEGFSRIYIP